MKNESNTAESRPKKWLRLRHRIIRWIGYFFVYPYTCLRYGIKIEKFRENKRRQYLILYNHQTPFDQFFVALTFRDPVYYLASEDIFSNGLISRLLTWAVAPIPIKKGASDVKAVKDMAEVAKEGGTIAIAPEGNRTYSGHTCYISPAIASMARILKLPIVILKIEGGYRVQPRWSDVIRRGRMRSYVSAVIEPEEYLSMKKHELADRIRKELWAEESELPGRFEHKKRAEYLERMLYVCPFCGLSAFESKDAAVRCTKCGAAAEYTPEGTFQQIEGEEILPFHTAGEWYDYQERYVGALPLEPYKETPMYRDTADLYRVIVYKRKERLRRECRLALYGDRITVDEGTEEEMSMPFSEIRAAAVLGRNKLNIYFGDELFQVKGGKRFNALKYVNMYYHSKHTMRDDGYGEFLGL